MVARWRLHYLSHSLRLPAETEKTPHLRGHYGPLLKLVTPQGLHTLYCELII